MNSPTVLGFSEMVTGFTLKGCPSAQELAGIMLDVIAAIGMTPDGPPDICHYPNCDGKGGEGVQIYQKLTESYMISGTWPVFNKTRVLLSSCKPYDTGKVRKLLEKRIGPKAREAGGLFYL